MKNALICSSGFGRGHELLLHLSFHYFLVRLNNLVSYLHHDLEGQVRLFQSDHHGMQIGFIAQKFLQLVLGTFFHIVDLLNGFVQQLAE